MVCGSWPQKIQWKTLWDNIIGYHYRPPNPRRLTRQITISVPPPRPDPRNPQKGELAQGQRLTHPPTHPCPATPNHPTADRPHAIIDPLIQA